MYLNPFDPKNFFYWVYWSDESLLKAPRFVFDGLRDGIYTVIDVVWGLVTLHYWPATVQT